ncbi:MAG: hypothetical protein P8P30_07345 [Rickettsiales bacterium]|nr:hypothetical protein [Rickettsiales bacterium]
MTGNWTQDTTLPDGVRAIVDCERTAMDASIDAGNAEMNGTTFTFSFPEEFAHLAETASQTVNNAVGLTSGQSNEISHTGPSF